LREYLDARLYENKTYADLYGRSRAPIVILNATDMSSGEVFSFTRDRFDDLCSDLAPFPIAAAVAASAAFPIALTPLTLKNNIGDACHVERRPAWVNSTLRGQTARF